MGSICLFPLCLDTKSLIAPLKSSRCENVIKPWTSWQMSWGWVFVRQTTPCQTAPWSHIQQETQSEGKPLRCHKLHFQRFSHWFIFKCSFQKKKKKKAKDWQMHVYVVAFFAFAWGRCVTDRARIAFSYIKNKCSQQCSTHEKVNDAFSSFTHC